MTADQFVMWLHGYLEISNPKEIGEKETQIIKDHLNLLFDKKTPDRSIDFKKTYEEQVKVTPKLSELEEFLKKSPPIAPYKTVSPTLPAHGILCTCPICSVQKLTVIC